MSILLQNGTLALPGGPRKADLLVENGRIAAIGEALPAGDARVLDCAGKLVLPGCIDTHTHFDINHGLPTASADDWASGSRSALWGGTTTVLDFAEPERGPLSSPLWTPGTAGPTASPPATTPST